MMSLDLRSGLQYLLLALKESILTIRSIGDVQHELECLHQHIVYISAITLSSFPVIYWLFFVVDERSVTELVLHFYH